MKLQHLAIIFVIIMLPISMVITYYIQKQVDTITFQTQYDSKLQTATHDAIKAFQINTINNKYSTVSDSKIRDIEASISTFYNSLGTELGASGFEENELKEYIPAMVYTMQDGYYIYSKYYNDTINDYQFGLRPYIYYSCRYKKGINDFVVNYSLDNFVTIYGNVGNEYVTKSAPLINPNLVTEIKKNENEDVVSLKYDNVLIEKEILKEQLVLLDDLATNSKPVVYEYIKYGNKKVYKDDKGYFWNNNDSKLYITDKATLDFAKKWTENGHLYSNSAVQYFVEAYDFSLWVNEKLSDITQKDAIDANGNPITDFAINTGGSKIFTLDDTNNPLLDDSVFNQNRISVIRKSIESNLSTAIANFGAGADYEFVMPIFTEEDWDKLVNNISVAAFMQGIPIGAKYYNNYCIITNNKNEEHVSKESIYIITNDMNNNDALSNGNEVHRASSADVIDNRKNVIGAYKNVDFEKQTVVVEDADPQEHYFHPHANDKCYECMVNVAQTYNIDDIIKGKLKVYDLSTDSYVDSNIDISNLRKIYLTALARERYDLNNIIGDNNDYTEGTQHVTKENIIITLNINSWTNQNVIATASTKLTNVTLQTSKDNITWQNVESQIFDKNGVMYARAIDASGKEISVATRVITNIDKNPPTKTDVDLNGYTSGTWTKSNVKITATAIDYESGINYFQYTTDNGNTIFTMPNPYLITWNGEWNFLVRAVDGAGNIGEWSNAFTVRRDAIVPSVPAVIYVSGQNTHKWQNNINIKLTSRSEGSAIDHYEIDTNNDGITDRQIAADGKFIPENGYSSCNTRFRAVNALGNASEWSIPVHIHMDTEKPSKTYVDLNGYISGEWTKSDIKITLNATDNAKIGYYEYTTDKNYLYTVQTNPWIINNDCDITYYVRARDEAGNIGDWSEEFTIKRLNKKPDAPTIKYNSGGNIDKWQNNIDITLSTTNHKVAIDHYEVDWNGDGITDKTIPANGNFIPWNGYSSCNNRFRSIDIIGNTSNWTDSVHIHMDTEKPKYKSFSPISVDVNKISLYIFATDNIKVEKVLCNITTSNKSETGVNATWDGEERAYRLDINPNEYGTNLNYEIEVNISDEAQNETTVNITFELTGVQHIHTGDPINGGGCYGKQHKHKTDECHEERCNGQLYTPHGTHYIHQCRSCGKETANYTLSGISATKGSNCNIHGKCSYIVCKDKYSLNCGKTETFEGYTFSY